MLLESADIRAMGVLDAYFNCTYWCTLDRLSMQMLCEHWNGWRHGWESGWRIVG